MGDTSNLQQGSRAWHDARRGKLTASIMGYLLGICKWKTRAQAWNDLRGLGDDLSENKAVAWGSANELNGTLEYMKRTANRVEMTGLHVHPTYDWIAGSPDGLVGSEGLLEVKCPFYRQTPHLEVPAHYYIQMQVCLACTSRKWCDYVSWTPFGTTIHRVTRDADLFNILVPEWSVLYAAWSRGQPDIPILKPTARAFLKKAIDLSMAEHIEISPDLLEPLPNSDAGADVAAPTQSMSEV